MTIGPQREIENRPTIALLPWGALLEDWLTPLRISLESFCNEFRGSWIFGYADALKSVGIQTVIILVSGQVTKPSRYVHRPTGATLWLLPAPTLYHALHRRMVYPYGQTVREAFGEIRSWRRVLYPLYAAAREIGLYFSTPHRAIARIVAGERCAALLCQEYEYPRFDTCVLLGKLIDRPVFGCFQGGNYHHNHLERATRGPAIRACAGLIIPTESERRRVVARYNVGPHRIAQIFNPVDTDVWKPDDRSEARVELGIPPQARVAAWHGRIVLHKKGLDILLDAWERVRRSHADHDVRLLLVGTGDDASDLARRPALQDGSDIVWINRFLHDPQIVRRHLSAADIYVFSSRYEGFPVALLEAMACGLPVVATKVEGVAEILDAGEASGGVVVARDDADALAAELGRLLVDIERSRELGRRARHQVATRFSVTATGESLRALFLCRDAEPGSGPVTRASA